MKGRDLGGWELVGTQGRGKGEKRDEWRWERKSKILLLPLTVCKFVFTPKSLEPKPSRMLCQVNSAFNPFGVG